MMVRDSVVPAFDHGNESSESDHRGEHNAPDQSENAKNDDTLSQTVNVNEHDACVIVKNDTCTEQLKDGAADPKIGDSQTKREDHNCEHIDGGASDHKISALEKDPQD